MFYLVVFIGVFQPSGIQNHFISTLPLQFHLLSLGGKAALAERRIAAVHHSCRHCLLSQIYIIFACVAAKCQLARSVSMEVTDATNANESPETNPHTNYLGMRRVCTFTSLSTV